MNLYSIYIFLIILIKIIFICLSIYSIILKKNGYEKTDKYSKIIFWKDRIEFIFVVAMALLLIYLFNSYNKSTKCIDYETRILLFLFGIILIITAKWNYFITTSPLVKDIQVAI